MSEAAPASAPPVIVLVGTQDLVNLAGVIRLAKNFGIDRVRLAAPRVAVDPWRIEGIAHQTADLVARMTVHPSLEDAVADCVFVAGLTARERTAKRRIARPRAAAAELAVRSAEGPVALVAGREDSGLTNAELDLCHGLVTIPTAPDHRSLNLAQAVGILCYESWLARHGEAWPPLKPPRRAAPAAPSARLELLFRDWERALWAIEFFKIRRSEVVMRSLRELLHRAALDTREAGLLRSLALETVHFLERRGVPFELPERLRDVGRPEEAGPGGAEDPAGAE
ncbi:MAG TPA: TrmH family RNA methyltransferase [Gemmatimonadales bacterium]|nr:TrmH family RNA methyltransferase [Gemmatimonadales bacterium]